MITEVEYQIRDSDAKAIFTGPDQVAIALQAASEAGLSRRHVYLFADPDEEISKEAAQHGLPSWTTIWRPAAEVKSWSWRTMDSLNEAKQTTAIINYSSGYVQTTAI